MNNDTEKFGEAIVDGLLKAALAGVFFFISTSFGSYIGAHSVRSAAIEAGVGRYATDSKTGQTSFEFLPATK
jgi:hypothetical protein